MINIDLKVGNDNGNSEHDLIINGKQICQPNVYAKVRKLPMLDEVNPNYVAEEIEDNLIAIIDSPSVIPGIYYIGNYALNSGEKVRSIEVGADNNKIDSKVVVINTLAQIGGYAASKVFLNNVNNEEIEKEIIKVKVDMTTALPINQYSKENSNEFAKKFDGIHKLTIMIGTKRISVEVEFNFVKVLPEGVTTVHALKALDSDIFEEYNKINKMKFDKEIIESFMEKNKCDSENYFNDKKILHIAIGEGTTEYPVTEGIIFNPNFISGSNNGIGHAIDRSLKEFKDELGLLNYSRQKYSEILKCEDHKYYAIAQDIIANYIEEEAEEILHNAKMEIEKANNEIDVIMVYGGGSIPMRKELEKKLEAICEKADIKLLYIEEKYCVILESLGMYAFTKGEIFEKIKEMTLNK